MAGIARLPHGGVTYKRPRWSKSVRRGFENWHSRRRNWGFFRRQIELMLVRLEISRVCPLQSLLKKSEKLPREFMNRVLILFALTAFSLPSFAKIGEFRRTLSCSTGEIKIVFNQLFTIDRGYEVVDGWVAIEGFRTTTISAKDLDIVVKPPYRGPPPVSIYRVNANGRDLLLKVWQSADMFMLKDTSQNTIDLDQSGARAAVCLASDKPELPPTTLSRPQS